MLLLASSTHLARSPFVGSARPTTKTLVRDTLSLAHFQESLVQPDLSLFVENWVEQEARFLLVTTSFTTLLLRPTLSSEFSSELDQFLLVALVTGLFHLDLELLTELSHVETTLAFGSFHLRFSFFLHPLSLKVVPEQVGQFTRHLAVFKLTVDLLLTLLSLAFTFLELPLSLEQSTLSLLFLTDAPQVSQDISSLFLSDQFSSLPFCFSSHSLFLQERLLDSLRTVISIQASTIQLEEVTQFFTSTFSGSSDTLKSTSLFSQDLVLLARLFHLTQESLFLVTSEEFTPESLLVFLGLSFGLTTDTLLVLTLILVLTLQQLQESLPFLQGSKSLAGLQLDEVVQEILASLLLFSLLDLSSSSLLEVLQGSFLLTGVLTSRYTILITLSPISTMFLAEVLFSLSLQDSIFGLKRERVFTFRQLLEQFISGQDSLELTLRSSQDTSSGLLGDLAVFQIIQMHTLDGTNLRQSDLTFHFSLFFGSSLQFGFALLELLVTPLLVTLLCLF